MGDLRNTNERDGMQTATPNAKRDELSDADIAHRIAAGDRDAFRLLMRRHNQTLYRTARSILKDDAEAEDAVQEAYLLAYRAMAGFRGDAKLSTWLVRIVANEAIGRLRKRIRRAEVIPLNEPAEQDAVSAGLAPDDAWSAQPERVASRMETRRMLEARIDRLPDAFRAVFVLRAVEELTVEETAAALEIPQATVRTRFFRARSLLRESIARDADVALEDAFAFAGERCDRIVAGVLARLG
jgi:RNA polymerase sigma-70 factor (ECF subfamily)